MKHPFICLLALTDWFIVWSLYEKVWSVYIKRPVKSESDRKQDWEFQTLLLLTHWLRIYFTTLDIRVSGGLMAWAPSQRWSSGSREAPSSLMASCGPALQSLSVLSSLLLLVGRRWARPRFLRLSPQRVIISLCGFPTKAQVLQCDCCQEASEGPRDYVMLSLLSTAAEYQPLSAITFNTATASR